MKLAILKSVTHRADGVGIAGVDAVEDVCGGVGLRAGAARRALLLLLVAGGGVVAGARVELKGAQVPPANRTPIVIWNLIKIYDECKNMLTCLCKRTRCWKRHLRRRGASSQTNWSPVFGRSC